jgi:membrane fusion protein, multidrug efflux system
MKKKKIIFLAAVAAAGVLLAAVVILKIRSRQAIERPPTIAAIQEEEGIPITAVSPSRRDMPAAIILDGTVEPDKQAVLVSRINRRIEKITVDEGDRIGEGETAVFLEQESLESALQAAQTALEEARRDYRRAEVLFESGAVAQQALDQARVNRDGAEARYLQARETLGDTEIASPLSGLVSRRRMEPGEFSDAGKPILEIVDISSVEIHSPVSEMMIGSIRLGQPARVYPDAYPDRSWESSVTTISPTTREASRLFTVKIRIPNPDELLRPGMYCRVEIVTEHRPDALVLPQEAIARDARGREGVYLIDKETATVSFQKVETGFFREGMVEIVSGLDPDAAVAASDGGRLTDGGKVIVVEGSEQ